jgi:hypothetical protein
MDSLLQKFLSDAESSGLPEGEFLLVANNLKSVFDKVKTATAPSTIIVEGDGDRRFTLKLKPITQDGSDQVVPYSLEIEQRMIPNGSFQYFRLEEEIERLLLHCSPLMLKITTSSIKMTIELVPNACFMESLRLSNRGAVPEYYNIGEMIKTLLEA